MGACPVLVPIDAFTVHYTHSGAVCKGAGGEKPAAAAQEAQGGRGKAHGRGMERKMRGALEAQGGRGRGAATTKAPGAMGGVHKTVNRHSAVPIVFSR